MQISTNSAGTEYLSFEGGKLPAHWVRQERRSTFERVGLRSNGGEVLLALLPNIACRSFELTIEFEAIDGAHLTYQDGTIAIIVDLTKGTSRIVHAGRRLLAEAHHPKAPVGERYRLTFLLGEGQIGAVLNDREIIAAANPTGSAFYGHIDLGLWDDLLVYGIRTHITGERIAPVVSAARKGNAPFQFEMTVDFVDDVIRSPWTHAMLDELFSKFKRWGVTRCHWIYYGKFSDGLWEYAERIEANIRKTYENVGDILPAAVRAARAHGIELYAILKPFDLGYNLSYGEGTEQARQCGKRERIGGPVGWVADFIAQNPHLLMARKPGAFGPARQSAFHRIDLVKEDTSPADFSVNELELYVSDDNVSYRPYEGAILRAEVVEDYPVWRHTSSGGEATGSTAPRRVMRLSGLDLKEPYFAIRTPSCSQSFCNTLINLAHVYGGEGRELRLTYGVHTRMGEVTLNDKVLFEPVAPDFRKTGVEFDVVPHFPTACAPGYDAISAPHVLDSEDGFLAFARGKDRSPVAALSPSFPEVRQWWLRLISDCLEAGVDGVELRVRNHHSPFMWAEYGFEEPVRNAFLERTGVDIWETDDFDKGLWRRLRGESYTAFCREAKALVESAGRKLGLHISATEEMDPEVGGAMGLHFDWRTWLEERIPDSVTMKEVWPGTPLAEAILSITQRQEIPVHFSPYANNIWNLPGGEEICDYWIHLAKENGFSGYQFYECAAIVSAKGEDCPLEVTAPAIEEVFRQHFVPPPACGDA